MIRTLTRTLIRTLIRPVYSLYLRLWHLPRIDRSYRALSVTETFRDVYRTKAWGDNGEPFFSGDGSRGTILEQYCTFAVKFIRDHQVHSIVDLGCGDFAVGKRITEASGVLYTGVDVVPELIEHHQTSSHGPRVKFLCADITKDPLPRADLYLVRQVLQHLSNREISRVLANLGKASHVLISEDLPVHAKWFNIDKAHGANVRSYSGSGVYVDRPPFSMAAVELSTIPLNARNLLRTVVLGQAGAVKDV